MGEEGAALAERGRVELAVCTGAANHPVEPAKDAVNDVRPAAARRALPELPARIATPVALCAPQAPHHTRTRQLGTTGAAHDESFERRVLKQIKREENFLPWY